jgi:hypothetical protein
MICKHLLLSLIIFSMHSPLWARTQRPSLCSLQGSPEKFLNLRVEVQVSIFAGVEYPRIADEQCSFRFAYGDDYQTFGDRFPIKDDDQWKLPKELLSKTECASNVRVAKATITGTLVRVPATGTIPQEEMPFELIIQSASDGLRVPVKCTPRAVHIPQRGRCVWSSVLAVSCDAKRCHYPGLIGACSCQSAPNCLIQHKIGGSFYLAKRPRNEIDS